MYSVRNRAKRKPKNLSIGFSKIEESDVPLFLYDSLEAVTLRKVRFGTSQVREQFLYRLMNSRNLTSIRVQFDSFSNFPRNLIRRKSLKPIAIFFDYIETTQSWINLFAIALKESPQIERLNLYKPAGGNFKFATIIASAHWLKRFELFSQNEIPCPEVYLASQGLLAEECKLKELSVWNPSNWAFENSEMNEKFMVSAVEKSNTIARVNCETRRCLATLWPTFVA